MSGTLVTALNPAIDAEWSLERVQWEEKNTIERERRWPGGKGVNVARWLRHLGGSSRLLVPLGGESGRELVRQLYAAGLRVARIRIAGSTRVNVIVTQKSGPQMRFNPRGPRLSQAEWRDVFAAFEQRVHKSTTVILSGSLPRSASVNTYARMTKLARRTGVKCLLDCDGPALTAAVVAKPFLVKPNQHELAQWDGTNLTSANSTAAAALRMSAMSGGWVLVSCGSAGGLLVNSGLKVALRSAVPRVATKNSVGAGDALLAAVAQKIEQSAAPQEWLRWGLATGTAATQCLAGELPPVALIRKFASRIQVEDFSAPAGV